MVSNIDPTKPLDNVPADKNDLRSNLAAAQIEIEHGGFFGNRTTAEKLTELSSVKDFGAAGDGVTDDLAAIQAAELVHDCIIFDSGPYLISSTWQPARDKTYLFLNTRIISEVENGRAIEIGMNTKFLGHFELDCGDRVGSTAIRFGPFSSGVVQPAHNSYIQSCKIYGYTVGGLDLYSDSNSGVYQNTVEKIEAFGTGFGIRLKTETGINKVNSNMFGLANLFDNTHNLIVDNASSTTFNHLNSERSTDYGIDIIKARNFRVNGGFFENQNDSAKNLRIGDSPNVTGVYICANIEDFDNVIYNDATNRSVVFETEQYMNVGGRLNVNRLDIGPDFSSGDDIGSLDRLRVSGGMYCHRLSGGSPHFYFISPASGAGFIHRSGSTVLQQLDGGNPSNDWTAMHLLVNRGGVISTVPVKLGAAGSGGAGFRALVVDNGN